MRWQDERRSSNVEDLRQSSNTPLAMGGAPLLLRFLPFLLRSRFGRILLIGGIAIYFGGQMLGIDVLQLLNPASPLPRTQAKQPLNPVDQQLGDFVAVILGSTEDTWHQLFTASGRKYHEPILVLFRNQVRSACGLAGAAMGPFYCPADRKLYIDLSFYEDMKQKLGAPGDFAQAYVIAHEVGHHVQNLLGVTGKVQAAQQNMSQEASNRLSVKQELQADCFAGIWGFYAKRKNNFLETGDLEEALNAAGAIGDDRLQQQANRPVRPESFTHGSAKERVFWFKKGFDEGSIEACNTFQNQ